MPTSRNKAYIVDDEETRHDARISGVSAFFRKPVDSEALLDAMRWAICAPAPAE